MKNTPSKLMIKTQIRNAKINRITFLVTGILICLIFGFIFPIAFIIGGFFIYISYLTNKKNKELLNESVKLNDAPFGVGHSGYVTAYWT